MSGFRMVFKRYELKTMGGIPLWMTKVLSENRIYRAPFNKYGDAYGQMVLGKEPGICTALSMRDPITERLDQDASSDIIVIPVGSLE